MILKKVISLSLAIGMCSLLFGCGDNNTTSQPEKQSKETVVETYMDAFMKCDAEQLLSLVPDSCKSYLKKDYSSDEEFEKKVEETLISNHNGSVSNYDYNSSFEDDEDSTDFLTDFLSKYGFTGKIIEAHSVKITLKVDEQIAKDHFGGETVNYISDYIFECDDEQWYSYTATCYAAIY